jgi:hypothetical protein
MAARDTTEQQPMEGPVAMLKFAVPAAAIALIGLLPAAPALARPPTVMSSPGYDRRLQDSRQAPAQDLAAQPQQSSPPAPGHRRSHRKPKPHS